MSVQSDLKHLKEIVEREIIEKTSKLKIFEELLAGNKEEIGTIKAKMDEERLAIRQETADEVESLRQELNGKMQIDQKEIARIAKEIADIQSASQAPWFKDAKFWGGVAALPALVLGGWLVKAAFQDPALLRLIHKGFGTEVALTEALEDDSELRSRFESAVTQQIFPTATDISDALMKKMGPEFVSKKSLEDDLRREIGLQFRVQHIAVLSTGIQNIDDIKFPEPGTVDLRNTLETTSTTVFAALPGQKININVGLNINQVDFDLLKKSREESDEAKVQKMLLETLKESTGSAHLDNILVVRLDGKPIKFEKQWDQFTYPLRGKEYQFQHYRIKGIEIPDQSGGAEFPLHTITVELLPNNENLIVTTPVIISRG